MDILYQITVLHLLVLRGTQSRVRHTNVGFSTGINHGRTLIVKEAEVVVQHGKPYLPYLSIKVFLQSSAFVFIRNRYVIYT